MAKRTRVVFHIDMNSFYASVEVAHNPSLRGKPVAIGGNPKERRGIIVTSTYEARAQGVKTTMPIWKALRLCPNLIIIPPNRKKYKKASAAIFDILRTYTPLVEQVSIDEGYIDVSSYLPKLHPVTLAKMMQKRLAGELHLPCSIGIAPNKFLAKMASDMKKPNGITVLRKRELDSMLWPLPIGEMYGIGKRTVDRWIKHDIHTIGDLAHADEGFILEKFGEHGLKLQQRAQGIDNRPVDPEAYDDLKSIGHSTTLRTNTRNQEVIDETLTLLTKRVVDRLQSRDLFAGGVQLMIRYHNWESITRSKKLTNPLQDKETLLQEVHHLFQQSWNGEPIRLLGVSTYSLIERKYASKQLDLFTYWRTQKRIEAKKNE